MKALDLMIKNGVFGTSLIGALATLLVQQIESQFQLSDEPDSNYCNDYKIGGKKVTIYDDKLVFKNSSEVFTLRGDVQKVIIE